MRRARRRPREIIPARAGNKARCTRPCGSAWNHPCARGTVKPGGDGQVVLGIIPARAGNSWSRWTCRLWPRDHPRACGEQPLTYQRPALPLGSSPRMQGTVIRAELAAVGFGIIPARAGNRCLGRPTQARSWDHPRVRGEHHSPDCGFFLRSGSSPRVRGAACLLQNRHEGRGVIPAYAGSSRCRQTKICRFRDHPRVCGEQLALIAFHLGNQGSSPRVRGAGLSFRLLPYSIGIIPACAGSSRSCGPRTSWCRDHPRACGEQPVSFAVSHDSMGSSPRVRGAERLCALDDLLEGNIPACVGSSHLTRRPTP